MKKFLLSLILLALMAIPLLSFAFGEIAVIPGGPTITGLLSKILSALWKITAGIAMIFFIISGIMFMTSGGEPEKLKLARASVIYGIVGIVVAIIAYSIVTIIEKALA